MEFSFELAKPQDDPALRQLLADSPMPGRITISFEREPNYFLGCTTLGSFWQVIIARHTPSQEIAGVMCRAVRHHYINGEAQNLGYIGQIRIAEKYRSLWLLQRGLSTFRELHSDNRASVYWGAISDENAIPRGVLVERRRRNFPVTHEVARIYTLGIILGKPRLPLLFDGQIQRGSVDDLPEITAFLRQHGSQRQFFPVYSDSDFSDGEVLRDFSVKDFLVARRNEKIVGVIGLWDQIGYKQSVVRSYDTSLKVLRPFYNFGGRFFGAQPLPGLGEHIHSAYASFICVANDDKTVFSALLRAIYNLAVERHYAYLMVGLAYSDPLLPLARKYKHIAYHSRVYVGSWQVDHDQVELYKNLDDRVPYFEIAAL